MYAIVLLPVILLLMITMVLTGWSASKPDRGVILGTTLPYSCLQDDTVLNLQSRYRRSLLTLSGAFLLPAGLLFLIRTPFSLFFAAFFLWLISYLTAFAMLIKRYERKLRQLKKERGWIAGKKMVISIDTEVARIREKMPVSALWMLPSLLISLLPLGVGLLRRLNWLEMLPAFSGLFLHGLFWVCRWFSIQGRSEAYCQSSQVNRACHYLSIRLWTRFWAVMAAVTAVCFSAAWYFSLGGPEDRFWLPVLLLSDVFVLIFGTYLTYLQVRNRRNRLLEAEASSQTADEDDFWRFGCYINPYDPRVVVEKRLGIGWTVNLGTAKGKALGFGIFGFAAALIVVMMLLFIRVDMIPFTMAFEDGKAKISAGMYAEDFSLEEIQKVELIDHVPDGSKLNGAATGSYLLGHFRMDGYGSSLVYVYPESLPCLVLSLSDQTVFFTARNPEDTVAAYEALAEKIS